MQIESAWTENPVTLLQQRVLVSMSDDEIVEAVTVAGKLGTTPQEVGHAFDVLSQKGLVQKFSASLAATFTEEASCTPSGKSLVATWEAQRTPARIKQSCTGAMLSWLAAHEGERILSTEEFEGDVRAHFFGVPFSLEVLAESARELEVLDLIKGAKTWGGPVLRPSITSSGRVVAVHHGGDLVAWEVSKVSGGSTFNITNSTGVAVANNSPGATQTVTVTQEGARAAETLAIALERLLKNDQLTLEPLDLVNAYATSGELLEEARSSAPDPSRLRGLVEAVKVIGVNAAGSATGSGLIMMADQALTALG
ncbi:hypothetical protein [Nocardioides alcanivorans]|uniref:hypothetical protein n=1 Tax=Nocardioides alcanivorans TaxID=2897352 RepID=UPI001F2E4C1F|nr:hypothetical protein [Nocardioides alcanivorans]